MTNEHGQNSDEGKTQPDCHIEGDVVLDEREGPCKARVSPSNEPVFLPDGVESHIISHLLFEKPSFADLAST